jgi:hypothetical protein
MALAFSEPSHSYFLDGVRVPSVTQLLQLGGYVTPGAWFSEKAAQRGTEVHRLTADFDLGALTLEDHDSLYAGYLEAHVKAMKVINPVWEHIEQAFVHPGHKVAGRPDRVGRIYGAMSVCDLKTGGPADWHPLQLALQCVIVADTVNLPAEEIHRYAIYLSRTGSYRVQRHEDRRDFDRAYELLRRFAG